MVWPMVIMAGVSLASAAMQSSSASAANKQAGQAARMQFDMGRRQQDFTEKRYRDELAMRQAENAFMSGVRNKQLGAAEELYGKAMEDYALQRGWALEDRDRSVALTDEMNSYARDEYRRQIGDRDAFQGERAEDRALRNEGYLEDRAYLGEVYGSELDRIRQDMELRDSLLGMAADYGATVDDVIAQLGQLEEIPDFLAALQGETTDRTAAYQQDVDRALERAGSSGAADMIRRGMDRSTLEVERERDLAAQGAKLYQDARLRAAQEALQLVAGRQQTYLTNRGARADDRGRQVKEATGGQAATLEAMMKMLGDRKPTIAPKASIEPESYRNAPSISAPNLAVASMPRIAGLPSNPYAGIQRLDTSLPSMDFAGNQASSRALGYYGDEAQRQTGYAQDAMRTAGNRFEELLKNVDWGSVFGGSGGGSAFAPMARSGWGEK